MKKILLLLIGLITLLSCEKESINPDSNNEVKKIEWTDHDEFIKSPSFKMKCYDFATGKEIVLNASMEVTDDYYITIVVEEDNFISLPENVSIGVKFDIYYKHVLIDYIILMYNGDNFISYDVGYDLLKTIDNYDKITLTADVDVNHSQVDYIFTLEGNMGMTGYSELIELY